MRSPVRRRAAFGERRPAYDLEDRLVEFAVLVARIIDTLPATRMGRHIASQLTRCATSPAPNYGEAQGAESRRDFIHKLRVCLKELREAQVWLRMAARLDLGDSLLIDDGLEEGDQLVAILFRSVETAERNRGSGS